jgi:hypothetical protein
MATVLNPYTQEPVNAVACKSCPALVRLSQETCSLDCWYLYQLRLQAASNGAGIISSEAI